MGEVWKLPLRAVSAAITGELLEEVLRILHHDLQRWWRLAAPRIASAKAPKSPVLADIDNLARQLITPGKPETKPAITTPKPRYLRRLVRALVGL